MPKGVYKRTPAPPKPCTIEGCDRFIGPSGARGMCPLHYGRWRKYGDPLREPPPSVYDPSLSIDAQRSAAYRARHPGVGARNTAAWRRRHPEGKADDHRLRRYGLTRERYDALLVQQGGCCAICGIDDPGWTTRWPVDHDHSCCPGKTSCGQCVRGLLCHACNRRLEAIEAPGFVELARRYLLL